MPPVRTSQIEVYLFRRTGARVRFLTLRRASGGSLPNVWQPVTGSLRSGEGVLAAARREVLEETGLTPRRWWALETVTLHLDPASGLVRALPLFAAEVRAGDPVRLSQEHDAFRFLSAPEAARRYLWRSQIRALEAVRADVLPEGVRSSALEITALMSRPTSRRR